MTRPSRTVVRTIVSVPHAGTARVARGLLVAALLVVATAGLVLRPSHAQASASATAESSNGTDPVVQAQALSAVAIQPRREAPATLVARNEARVASQVAGTVLRWTVDAGAFVKRGDLLAEIDARDYRLARDRARLAVQAGQTRLQLAQTQLRRARELVAQGFFSQEALNARDAEVQLLESELAAAQAQLAGAELELSRTRLAAPFDATVRQRLAQAGELVTPGTVLYVLTETGAAEVSAQIAPADVDSLQASQAVSFEVLGRQMPVVLARVSGSLSLPSRTVEARLQPKDADAAADLRPGSDGRLVWSDHRPHVPASLLVQRDGQLGVFVVAANEVRFVPLPQAQEGRAAAVELPPATRIVTRGQAMLRDGQRVIVGER